MYFVNFVNEIFTYDNLEWMDFVLSEETKYYVNQCVTEEKNAQAA